MAPFAATNRVAMGATGSAKASFLALLAEGAPLTDSPQPGDAHSVGDVDGHIGLADALVITAVRLTKLTATTGDALKVTGDEQVLARPRQEVFILAPSHEKTYAEEQESK